MDDMDVNLKTDVMACGIVGEVVLHRDFGTIDVAGNHRDGRAAFNKRGQMQHEVSSREWSKWWVSSYELTETMTT